MHRFFILMVILLFFFLSCKRDSRNISQHDNWHDSWYLAPVPYSFPEDKDHQVPYFRISEKFQNYFIKKLENRQWQEVSQESIDSVLINKSALINTKKHYIVRALYLNRSTGSYSVYVDSHNNILVSHGCLGKNSIRMTREVIVIELKSKPNKVFTRCSMIE
jgi:hypothetical protein